MNIAVDARILEPSPGPYRPRRRGADDCPRARGGIPCRDATGALLAHLVPIVALDGSGRAWYAIAEWDAPGLAVGEAKVPTTEAALAASNTLFELSGTCATLAAETFDRHWRNARTHTPHDPVRWEYAIVGNHALNGIAPPPHAWS